MKNKLSKGLSLSANPKHLIKGVFFAAQRVLAEFGVKNPSVHWRYMNFLRQRKTALDAPLYAVSLGRSLLPQCALDATGFLSDVYNKVHERKNS